MDTDKQSKAGLSLLYVLLQDGFNGARGNAAT